MNLAWLTDIHLNFLDADTREKFYQEIINTGCDAVLISGDIAEAPSLTGFLIEMAGRINKTIYFVLGNHDYYRGNIKEVRKAVTMLTKTNKKLFWLPASGIQQLDKHTILLGQDGWADGRLGDYKNSRISMNDSRLIADLFREKVLGKFKLLEKMQSLADEDAMQLKNDLVQAVNLHPKKLIILTHIPPFKEVCMHKDKFSDNDWLPYFSSQVIGNVLMQAAQKNSEIEFLVLCGHTHTAANFQALANLTINVGKAEYYRPEIQKININSDVTP